MRAPRSEAQVRSVVARVMDNPAIDILHVHPDPSNEAARIDKLLESTSLVVEVCGDVYRGLARLCTCGPTACGELSSPRAVVVCVDDLGPAELEFFSIVSRLCRCMPVYVYGSREGDSQAARAIELGATGPVTVEVLRSLAPPAVPPRGGPAVVYGPTEDAVPGAAVAEATLPELLAEERAPLEPPPAPHPAEVEPTTAEPDDVVVKHPEDEETEEVRPRGRARVPWLRYADQPVRTAPPREAPPPAEPAVEEPVEGRPADQEPGGRRPRAPLLTPAELQALLGDDIAAIAPPEPEGSDADERDTGEDTG